SEPSEVTRELLNASVKRDARVLRCTGDRHKPTSFSVYCPKVFATIGRLDPVLVDRSLPIQMLRRPKTVKPAKRALARNLDPDGKEIHRDLEAWAEANRRAAREAYAKAEPLAIGNDRLADLLLPLQATLQLDGADSDFLLAYAKDLEEDEGE